MAPEQIESEPMDQRTDIYAMGITTFEMLAGQNPLPETDAQKLIDLHLNCGILDPADVVANIPEALRQFILSSCQRNPDRRYQTVTKALDVLQHLARELDITGMHPDGEKKNMTSLFMVYKENQQPAVKQLMESLRVQAKELGIDLKSADLSASSRFSSSSDSSFCLMSFSSFAFSSFFDNMRHRKGYINRK